MSFKFEQTDTLRAAVPSLASTTASLLTSNKHPEHLLSQIGKTLTQANDRNGYLASYLTLLHSYPLRTKMATSFLLSSTQELLASYIARDKTRNGHYFTSRVPKMGVYGALISAPMGHIFISILQRMFRGRTSVKAKVLMVLISNLVIAPIQNAVYLIFMAIIAGARRWHQIRASLHTGFGPLMKLSLISSPIALAFAQQFLPEQTWVPFFNIVAFVIGTYINTFAKRKRIAALRRKAAAEERDPRFGGGSSRLSGDGEGRY